MDEKKELKFLTPWLWIKKLARIGPWLWSGRKGWSAVFIVIFLVLAPWLINSWLVIISESFLRNYGLIIQLLGFFFVLLGINSSLKELGLKSVLPRVWSYFRNFPILPWYYSKYVNISFHAKGTSSANFSGGVRYSGGSTEERLSPLEENYEELFKKLDKIDQQRNADKTEVLNTIEEIQKEIESGIDDVKVSFTRFHESAILSEFFWRVPFRGGLLLCDYTRRSSAIYSVSENYRSAKFFIGDRSPRETRRRRRAIAGPPPGTAIWLGDAR